MTNEKLVLEGIKVLELTHVISGSYAGMLLGDLGAEIIKVERPGYGEFYRTEAIKNEEGESIVFPTYNRNKKSITINMKSDEGIGIIKELAKEADIVIENMRPGLVNKFGLGYEDLKEINPDIIMISISGYGQTGPYSKKPAYDMTIAAASGFMSVNGPEDEPMKAGPAISDFLSGIYGAFSALVSLRHRDQTGQGQYIDVSMMECSMSILDAFFAQYKFTGNIQHGTGNRRANYAPVNAFKTKTGSIYISCSLDKHWKMLTELMDRPDLFEDERFKTASGRKDYEEELEKIVADWAINFDRDELVDILEKKGVTCAAIHDISEVVDDPQVKARESIGHFDYPTMPGYPVVKMVPKFSTIKTKFYRAPTMGEHTDEILQDVLNLSDETVKKYHDDGIV